MGTLLILILLLSGTCQAQINFQSDRELKMELCGKSIPANYLRDIDNYRFNVKSRKCYHLEYDNPCGKGMAFFAESENSINGLCDCKRLERTLIYHPDSDQCYSIFEQAYCPPKQWLTLSRETGKPICELNPCKKGKGKRSISNIGRELVFFNGRCVPLGSKHQECRPSQIVNFIEGRILPTCTEPIVQTNNYAIGALKWLKPCAPGSLKSLGGGCQFSWVW